MWLIRWRVRCPILHFSERNGPEPPHGIAFVFPVQAARLTDVRLLPRFVSIGRSDVPNDAASLMSDSERTAVRVLFDLEWKARRRRYAAAGQPFGFGAGLTLWVEFNQQTTVN